MVPLSRVATCFLLLLLVRNGAAQDRPQDSPEFPASPSLSLLLETGGEFNFVPVEMRISGSWTTASGWNFQLAPGLAVRQDGYNSNPWSPLVRMRFAPRWTHGKKASLGLTAGYRRTTFHREHRHCNDAWTGGFWILGWGCEYNPNPLKVYYEEVVTQYQVGLSLELWSASRRVCGDLHVGTQSVHVAHSGIPEGGLPGVPHPRKRFHMRPSGTARRPYIYLGFKCLLFAPDLHRNTPAT